MAECTENITYNGVFQSEHLCELLLPYDTVLRICERFDVQPGDIMEYISD